MFKFTDLIDPLYFFIAFAIGIFIVYIYNPPPRIVIKYPTPENSGKIIYKDEADVCYKYKAEKVDCPADKSIIKKNITEINADEHSNPSGYDQSNIFKQIGNMFTN
jgi:hypothetical protein